MIKEKYVPLITAIALVFAVVFTALTVYIKGNEQQPLVQEKSYVSQIFDKNKMLQIDIVIDEANKKDMFENAMNEQYYPANITVNGEQYTTVGIRPKGNSSLSMVAMDDTTDRFSFKLDFGQYTKGQNLHGLSKLALNNMIGDTTYMKEYLSYDMMATMGINTPAYTYANITLNGKPWGVYLAVEVMEEEFLERYYGSDYGNLYKPEGMKMGGGNKGQGGMPNMPNQQNRQGAERMPDQQNRQGAEGMPNQQNRQGAEGMPNQQNVQGAEGMPNQQNMQGGPGLLNKGGATGTNLVYTDDKLESYSGIFDNIITKKTTKSEQKKLIEIIKNLNEGDNLEKSLDVDEVLKYFAVNTFAVNLDSYAGSMKHNYYLYENDEKLQILPWDFNLSFAGFQVESASRAINFPIDAPVTDTLENSPLIAKLLENEEYKEKYHKYLSELVNKYITNGVFEKEVNRIDTLIGEYVGKDATAFYTYEAYQKSLPQLVTFSKDRAKSIALQLSGEQPTTTYGNVQTELDLTLLGTMGSGANKQGPSGERKMPMDKQKRPPIENMKQDTQTNKLLVILNVLKPSIVYLGIMLIGIFYVRRFKRKKMDG
ncbi:MAG: CotH kinase family protein [Cellulosilyticaceae bacterium]